MKQFLVFFFTLLISFTLFSQNKIGQIAYAQWDQQEDRWRYYAFDNWNYDEYDREETFYHRDSRYSDYLPTNNLNSSSKYDGAGNLIEKNNYHFGPLQWSNEFNQYSYNTDQEQTEQLITWNNSFNETISKYKHVFEKAENENRRSTKMFEQNDSGIFILKSQRDSFLTVHDCLKKEEILSFYDNGSVQHGRRWEMEYGADCQLLSIRFFKWNVVLEMMQEFNKDIYEYSDDGKKMTVTYFDYDQNTNQWETERIAETVYDDHGQQVRYFVESYKNNSIDSLLMLNTYTSKNEIETYQRSETRNFLDGRYFRRIENDSFSYHYDSEDRIILKEEFGQHYNNPVMKLTSTFEYYCNGLLKSETFAGDIPYSRKDYRYHGGADCPLAENDKSLLLFPNPTSGEFTIQSNLLSNSVTTIQVFTILGQEVFSEKINQMSYQYQLDLSSFGKGNYIIVVSNEEERVSEKLLVF